MKVFFKDKFYEAPKGCTPMDFCADCKLPHETCYGCPWRMVDMSKAVEITGITKEECDNFIKPPKKGHFYYSKAMENYGRKIHDCLVYCEGEQLDSDAMLSGMSFVDYARGIKERLESLKAEYHDMFYNDKTYKGNEIDCLYSYVGDLLRCHFFYNKDHFCIDIPENIWNDCVARMQQFNKDMQTIVEKGATEVVDKEYSKGHFYFNDFGMPGAFDVSKSITYVRGELTKSSTPRFPDGGEDIYAYCIMFDYYAKYGTRSNCSTQVHFDEGWKYEISEEVINELIELEKALDNDIETILKPYI